jgi:hypothetical protein
MRFFQTGGPCVPGRHYMLPAADRLPGARDMIGREEYFVVHAPRQSGKTTSLEALAHELTGAGTHVALRVSCASAKGVVDDVGAVERNILEEIRGTAGELGLPEELLPPNPWPEVTVSLRIRAGLRSWAAVCPLPIVLFFDEVDALIGPSLVSFLNQLRDGYLARPAPFIASAVLCGLRDVRDYKTAYGGDPARQHRESPWNISVESLRPADFTQDQVAALYGQFTAESGQPFTPEATERVFFYTQGQPWLVNAIAREITLKMAVPLHQPVTAEHVEQAKEVLVRSRATNLESLEHRLHEERVARVMAPVIQGEIPSYPGFDRDKRYLQDLGLLAVGDGVRVANPIYAEVIARTLTAGMQDRVDATLRPEDFLAPDGQIDMAKVVSGFAAYWTEHGETVEGKDYQEAWPHLLLFTYLQAVVNSHGSLTREYAAGRQRADIVIRRPYPGDGGRPQREVIEVKVWHPRDKADPAVEGLAQLDRYLDRLGLTTGVLAIFDARPDIPPIPQRTSITTTTSPADRAIILLRG